MQGGGAVAASQDGRRAAREEGVHAARAGIDPGTSSFTAQLRRASSAGCRV